MRNRYLVCYDVADPQRLVRTYKLMQGYGDPVQYSVFLCELSRMELVYMRRDLTDLLNLDEDRVLVVDTGPADSEGRRISTMGAPIKCGREPAVVV